tara:strand:+ start:142 stop:477 length:336 start_codon:yes stop_codon:yes gene_type:complete
MNLKPLDKKWVKEYSGLRLSCIMYMGKGEWRGETEDSRFLLVREESGVVGMSIGKTEHDLTDIKLLCSYKHDWKKLIEFNIPIADDREQITIKDIIKFMDWECDDDQIWDK